MFGIMRWRGTARTLSVSLVLAMLLNLGGVAPSLAAPKGAAKLAGKISEASPPEVIQQLKPLLDKYQPQVSIVSPRSNEVLDDNTVSVKFNVKDFPLYKDEKLGLGPHLHVFLDDQPYQAVYDVSQPLVLKDLAAGTHTIRAFAGRPWHESFKNDGAYAQTTFHVFTKTPNNNPDPKLPLLTYSRPQATYGAEPVLLDFYLTNAPLHIVAQEDDKDDVSDWRVKVTVNGDSFTLDRWQPIYLKGLKSGKNWVQLEYVDDKGNPVQNVYNNTARIFNYEPNGQDSLSRLVRGEIPFDQAVSIVDPNYKPAPKPVAPTPEPSPIPVAPPVEEKPTEPEVKETPQSEEAPKPIEEAPKPQGGFFSRFKRSQPKPSIPPSPEPSPDPEVIEPPATIAPEPEVIESPETTAPEPEEAPVIVAPTVPAAKPQGGFFNRFKRPTPPVNAPSPTPEVITEPEKNEEPEVITPEVPAIEPEEEKPSQPAPEVKESPKPSFFDRFKRSESKPPIVLPSPTPIPNDLTAPETAAPVEVEPTEPEQVESAPEVKESPKPSLFDRFKRSEPTSPVVLPSPTPIPDDLSVPEIEAPVEVEPAEPENVEAEPIPEVKESPKPSFFDRFKRSEPKPPVVLPSPTPVPDDLAIPETAAPVEVEPAQPEQVEVEPAPEVKASPKPSFFDRFKRSESKPAIVLPSPTPIPDDLSTPEVEAPVDAKPDQPEVKPEPTSSETSIQEKPVEAEEPAAETAPTEFEPQTELERRLGMPLKPRISQPPTNPQPALSSESAE